MPMTGRPPVPDRRLPPTRRLRVTTSAVQNRFRCQGPVGGSSFYESNRAMAPLIPASRRRLPNPLAFGFTDSPRSLEMLSRFLRKAQRLHGRLRGSNRCANPLVARHRGYTSGCGVSMFCADTRAAGTMAPKGSVINPVVRRLPETRGREEERNCECAEGVVIFSLMGKIKILLGRFQKL